MAQRYVITYPPVSQLSPVNSGEQSHEYFSPSTHLPPFKHGLNLHPEITVTGNVVVRRSVQQKYFLF